MHYTHIVVCTSCDSIAGMNRKVGICVFVCLPSEIWLVRRIFAEKSNKIWCRCGLFTTRYCPSIRKHQQIKRKLISEVQRIGNALRRTLYGVIRCVHVFVFSFSFSLARFSPPPLSLSHSLLPSSLFPILCNCILMYVKDWTTCFQCSHFLQYGGCDCVCVWVWCCEK